MSTLSGGPNIIVDGLVMYLDAANRYSYVSGSTAWNDLSRGGNNGTLINGPTFNSANGGSIVFDGINDYVNLGNPLTLSLNMNITLSTWINSTTLFSSQNFPPFIIKGINVSYMLFGNSLTNQIRIRIGDNNIANAVDSISTISSNIWYNVVGTYDGNNIKIYINGVLDNQKARIGTIPTGSDNIIMGFNPSGEALVYNGRISNTQIYNRALSAQEVLQNYNATKTRFGL
jgi:hypothetical protein